jgi:hypothetical protein
MMSDVSSVVATILPTTKDAPSIRNSSKKTYPSLRPKQYVPPAPLQRTLHTSPSLTYAQIAKQQTPATSTTTQNPQPLPQNSDMQELKEMMKQLFQHMGNTMNLLNTLLTKLM